MAPRLLDSLIPPQSFEMVRKRVRRTDKVVSVAPAEPVGMDESETSATPSISSAYVFTIKYDSDGPFLDRLYDVSQFVNMSWRAVLTAEKLTGERNDQMRSFPKAIRAMQLRSRFDGAAHGPYLLKFEEPTSIEELQEYLQKLDPDRRKALLEGATW